MLKRLLLILFFSFSSLTYSYTDSGLDDEGNPIPINQYDVVGDRILEENVPKKSRLVWQRFTQVIPAQYREEIQVFEPIDGNYGIDGSIHAINDDKSIWVVQLDIKGSVSEYDLDRTMIHEFAHLLTLRADQIPLADTYDTTIKEPCPSYALPDGCTAPDSYLNQFVSQFWQPHLPVSNSEVDALKRYQMHINEFVTEYAATNPAEDIAESFAEYVLAEQLPPPSSIANKKIRFFDHYRKLRLMRKNIRSSGKI
ncbi:MULTISPECIES: hypothetical protein [Vibrio]|uniref:Zinc-dependent peptidase n=1 Tax=Vibrio genomosp. F6 str. FF-238 TaxID=1191298 RepID=A0A1E5CWC6_9VIBR|nr:MULTISPECIES: hypothetical protein [Vibrio]NOH85850.1 hypothetical protein [Vibrio sp. 03-59-1]OEE74595.1 hypothetical protein A130_06225 [Vibrio genomosp. F6 str. FF-238]